MSSEAKDHDQNQDGDENSSSEEKESDDDEAEQDDPQRLEPPAFSLPADDDDYELWTIRLPVNVDPSSLDGIKISPENSKQMGIFKHDKQTYGLILGDSTETESFRVLVEDGDYLVPSKLAFARHIHVVHQDALKEIVETDLAPGIDRAPQPVDPVRKAYDVVPQKAGLKRRWTPMGVPDTGELSHTNKAQKLIRGMTEFHERRVKLVRDVGKAFQEKDKTPVNSPDLQRKRKRTIQQKGEGKKELAVTKEDPNKGEKTDKEEEAPSTKESNEERKKRKAEKKARKEAKKAKKAKKSDQVKKKKH